MPRPHFKSILVRMEIEQSETPEELTSLTSPPPDCAGSRMACVHQSRPPPPPSPGDTEAYWCGPNLRWFTTLVYFKVKMLMSFSNFTIVGCKVWVRALRSQCRLRGHSKPDGPVDLNLGAEVAAEKKVADIMVGPILIQYRPF